MKPKIYTKSLLHDKIYVRSYTLDLTAYSATLDSCFFDEAFFKAMARRLKGIIEQNLSMYFMAVTGSTRLSVYVNLCDVEYVNHTAKATMQFDYSPIEPILSHLPGFELDPISVLDKAFEAYADIFFKGVVAIIKDYKYGA